MFVALFVMKRENNVESNVEIVKRKKAKERGDNKSMRLGIEYGK